MTLETYNYLMRYPLLLLFIVGVLLNNNLGGKVCKSFDSIVVGVEAVPLFGSRKKDSNGNSEEEEVVVKQSESIIDFSGSPTIQIRGGSTSATLLENDVVKDFFAFINDNNESEEEEHYRKLQNEIHSLALSSSASPEHSFEDLKTFLVATRRRLHKHPELMYQESQTSTTIQNILTELNIPFTTGWAKNTHQDVIPGPGGYGIVADIGTGAEPCVLLRADIDALPIFEVSDQVFKSEVEGKMHACGHDGHTTMLLGAAAILKQMEDSIPGTIRLMFQPAEEGGAGAKRMIEEGVLEMQPPVSHAYGMHVFEAFCIMDITCVGKIIFTNRLPSGTIAARAGPQLAAADMFEIIFVGKGGHAAMPHLTIDPIVAASSLVNSLQTIVSRTISPLESGVVSITQLKSGQDVYNVIPADATLKGTIRALSVETLTSLRTKVEHMANATAAMHQCTVTVTYMPDFYPPTINDPKLLEFSKHVAARVSKEGLVRDDIEPTMGGEDFAFVAQAVPSTFFLLGQGGDYTSTKTKKSSNLRTNYGLHHPQFALDEDVMPRGVELHVTLALRTLKKLINDKKNGEILSS